MQYTTFLSQNSDQTTLLGETLAKSVELGNIVALYGTLGTGKTLFSKGFAKGLGITEPVTSPTFGLVHEYDLPDKTRLFHVDVYRLHAPSELDAIAPERFLFPSRGITLIEWAEKIEALLRENAAAVIPVYLYHHTETERRITIPTATAEKICTMQHDLTALVCK